MTKDELMQMARDAGFMFHDAGYAPTLHTLPKEYSDKCFDRFARGILERAAAACEAVTHMSAAAHGDLRDGCAASVRALKIKEGE